LARRQRDGGHLVKGCVRPTIELVVTELSATGTDAPVTNPA